MKHPHLKSKIERVNAEKQIDSTEIDRLYGLEPVIDTGIAEAFINEGMEATQFVMIACPYCGESYETQVDLTGGSFGYVEDCQVCCQPIDIKVETDEAGALVSVIAMQLNE